MVFGEKICENRFNFGTSKMILPTKIEFPVPTRNFLADRRFPLQYILRETFFVIGAMTALADAHYRTR